MKPANPRYRAAAAAGEALRIFKTAERRAGGTFRVLLSGGRAMEPFLRALARSRSFDWGRSRFYFVSDATAGPSPLPAYRLAKELFFSPAGVPDSSVVNIPPLRPRAAARLYSGQVAEAARAGGFGLAVLDASERLPCGLPGAAAVPGGAALTLGSLSLCREAVFLQEASAGKKNKAGRAAGPPEKALPGKAPRRLKKTILTF
ncbi:MAG TPA: hypothetical protein DDW67_02825 [Elusimicrobia bacterium]|nr:hypothetical protein [Elusimicrobiota bacterium]